MVIKQYFVQYEMYLFNINRDFHGDDNKYKVNKFYRFYLKETKWFGIEFQISKGFRLWLEYDNHTIWLGKVELTGNHHLWHFLTEMTHFKGISQDYINQLPYEWDTYLHSTMISFWINTTTHDLQTIFYKTLN